MRAVAHGATFAHCFVLENERLGLFAMTGGAGLVQARQGQSSGWLHDVRPVRIVTLRAVHLAFENAMMMRQVEFGPGLQMAIETHRRVGAGIENELPAAAANGDVLAARAVTSFASADAGFHVRRKVQPGMSARGECCDVIGMASQAGLIADESRAGNFGGNNNTARQSRAGIKD